MNYDLKMNDLTVSTMISEKIAKAMWERKMYEKAKVDSFGEMIQKKLLTIAKFMGLK